MKVQTVPPTAHVRHALVYAGLWATLILLAAATGAAQTIAEEAGRVTHELMSPFCPGLLLADCRSEGAFELRAEIVRRLETGEHAAAIEDDLIARFGPQVRTIPEFGGFGLLAWIGPAVMGVGGLALLVVAIRASTHRASQPDDRAESDGWSEDSATLERIREDLDDLD